MSIDDLTSMDLAPLILIFVIAAVIFLIYYYYSYNRAKSEYESTEEKMEYSLNVVSPKSLRLTAKGFLLLNCRVTYLINLTTALVCVKILKGEFIMNNLKKLLNNIFICRSKSNDDSFATEFNGLTKNNLSENEKTFIDISLTEYKELRTELREVISRQNSVLTSSIVQFATLLGIVGTILSIDKVSVKTEWISIILGLLIPFITITLGIVWLDLTYRQIRVGSYIYIIENKIIKLLHGDSDSTIFKALYWEHYIHNADKSSFLVFLSYICIPVVYAFISIGSLTFSVMNYGWGNVHILTTCICAAYIIICVCYGLSILKMHKHKNSL